jgi:hypothetical protein
MKSCYDGFEVLLRLLNRNSFFLNEKRAMHILKNAVGVLYRRTVNLYPSCVGLGWLAQETMGFILVRASEE